MLTFLTRLSLSISGTLSWEEKAGLLTAADLDCISALQALQVSSTGLLGQQPEDALEYQENS
jgi:hypothetical protein